MSLTTDVAWAAGLFEGEGSIILYKGVEAGRKVSKRRLSLCMKDEDVVLRFASIVGCGRVYPVHRHNRVNRENHHTIFRWEMNRWANIERILLAFLPYLGERRRAKADEVLADPPTRVGPRPVPGHVVVLMRELWAGGIAQEEIAQRCGVRQSTVSRYVNAAA